jgi:hypothetical protein
VNVKDGNGFTPDEDHPCACGAALQLAEMRGYIKALAMIAQQNINRLNEILDEERM